MKKTLLLFASLFISISIFSQTTVSGNQSGTWNANGSPYIVEGDITVPSGEVLTIEPGVTVKFSGHYKFNVNGQLIAEGTKSDTIFFTTDDIATGWWGIRIESSVISSLKYCKIEYGKTVDNEYPDQHGGGLMMLNSDAVIENCVFANNEATGDSNGMGGAIYAFNSSEDTKIINCTFYGNHSYGAGGAIEFTGDVGATVKDCIFKNNTVLYGGGAICFYGCYYTKITGSLFVDNSTEYSSGGVALIEGYSAGILFVNCTMYGNEAVHGDGGAVDLAFSEASFTNSIIYNNPGAYSDDIYLDFGYTEINYCNAAMPDDSGAEGGNNIYTDPMFTDVYSEDFTLLPSSPCIDAGIDSLTIVTAFGDTLTVVNLQPSEYVGAAPDMGYYEYDPSIGVEEKTTDNISVYPIPAKDFIYLKSENQNIKSLTVYDMNGKEIKMLQNNNRRISLNDVQNGNYILVISSDKGTYSRKFVVEK